MNIDQLTREEQELLGEILQNSLKSLETEILHTDDREFKELLKHRRGTLQNLIAKLQPVEALPT